MKNKLFLLSLIIFTGCAKPSDPTKASNPFYGSTTAVITGAETPCENCLMMETVGNSIRVSFSENGIEECSGQGNMSYTSDTNFSIPTVDGEVTDWSGQLVGDNSASSPFCFPDNLNLRIEQKSNNSFELDYNGKIFTIRRLN